MASSSSSSIPSSSSMAEKNADDVLVVISEQRRELSAALQLESDFDLAFRLQMEEALTVSLQASSSSSSAISPSPVTSKLGASDISTILSLQAQEFDRLEQECRDHEQSKGEREKIRTDLDILIHDRKFAAEVDQMPDSDWEDYGDDFEKPFDNTRCSTGHVTSETFRLYFKALPLFGCAKYFTYGLGVAICDSGDSLIFELQKVFKSEGRNRGVAEAKALLEGLNAAISLNLKRLNFYCDYYTFYQFMRGRWSIRQQKLADAVLEVNTLRGKFEWCNPLFVPRQSIKFAFKLARNASHRPVSKSEESSTKVKAKETCVICLEDRDVDRMFIIDGCNHQYCHSCMKQHVEVKLLHGMIPKCPHVGCKSDLSVEKCEKFLTTRLVEIMGQRIKEASVPVTEKVYCPYPRCSALMSKTVVSRVDALVGAQDSDSGARKCTKCHGLFCINCKVPWHSNMTCQVYKCLNPNAGANDAKLKSLASQNLWRQCVKCNHMIELAEGCYHMTCRCGYEFCYTCGAEWREKKATCKCPLWDEDNILYDDDDDDFDPDDDDDDDDYWDTVSEDDYI